MPGIITSSSARSKLPPRIFSSPSLPSRAVSTLKPCGVNARLHPSRMPSSSSMTRMLRVRS